MVTQKGTAKKVKAKDFHDVRRNGLIAIKLAPGDELMDVRFVEKGDTIVLVTTKGQGIRFLEGDIREMGRTAAGVRAMKLGKDDEIIGMGVAAKAQKESDLTLMVLSSTGYGKQTAIKEFKVQKRGGSGIKAASVTSKTGQLMASRIIDPEKEELVVVSKKGQVIRTGISEIPTLGRSTQGVRIMKLRAGDAIAALICL